MKTILAILMLASSCFAIGWSAFVSLPLEEKYLLANERLKQIEDGSLQTQYCTKAEAAVMRQSLAPWASEFSKQDPASYGKAMSNVGKYIKGISVVATQPTKFIKVGDHYVSEGVCKTTPEACVEPVSQANVTAPVVVKNKRTAAECGAAREKDWEIYCWQNAKVISCDAVSQADKTMVLDNLAQGYYSNQAICLRGD